MLYELLPVQYKYLIVSKILVSMPVVGGEYNRIV